MKTLFYGGTILTMDSPMYAEAVLTENGTVRAVGSLDVLKAGAGDCRTVDLKGRTMMPAFIDPHSHFFQVAYSFLQASVLGCTSAEQIGKAVSSFISDRKIQPGQWVNARDYDNNIMPGLQNPTLAELDSFAPNNPLVIHHKSGHMGLMNSRALKALGITADTPDPEGGKFEKKDGKLTGYMEENAFFGAIQKIPMADPGQLLQAFEDAERKYASYGITTVQDGMVAKPMLPLYDALLQKDQLYLDVKLYAGLDAYQETKDLLARYPGNKHLSLSGMKMFLDGSPQGRTAWMRTPYAGTPDYSGYGTMTDEAITNAFCFAAENHAQIIAHCNGDGASGQFLRCLEQAEQKYPELRQLRPVIIHGQLLGVDQLPKVKELGAMVSFFVDHVYHWGDVHIRNFTLDRASQISPAASALKQQVLFTFHQDAPVIEPDMLETVWCAVNRKTKDGVLLGENQKISVLDALKAVTVNAAYQYSEEKRRGSITAGKAADFVILDQNPLDCAPDALRDLKVLATYKAGSCIYHM